MTDPAHNRLRLPLSAETAGRIAQVASVILLTSGALGIVAGNDAVIGIGFGLGFVTLPLGALLPVVTWKQRQFLNEMVAGQRFVHWTCSREDWRRHLASEREPRMKPILYGLLFGCVIGLAVASLIAGVDYFRGRRMATDELVVGVAAAFVIPFIICGTLGSVFTVTYVVRDYLLRRGGGHIHVGRHGLYYSGEFWPSCGVNPRFLGIRRDAGPPSALVFEYHIKTPRRGSYDHQVRVPIPPGREPEAQHAVEQVRSAG